MLPDHTLGFVGRAGCVFACLYFFPCIYPMENQLGPVAVLMFLAPAGQCWVPHSWEQ